jgi:uncharacterized protein Smg (DUF494 family)
MNILLKMFHLKNHERNIKKFSNAELRQCFKELKQLFCNNKGYWETKILYSMAMGTGNENVEMYTSVQWLYALKFFKEEYHRRLKRECKGLNTFIDRLSIKFAKKFKTVISPNIMYKDIKEIKMDKIHVKYFAHISLIDNDTILDFLYELKVIRKKYLNCNDEDFFNLILNNIYTSLDKNTLKKMYYIS